MRLLKRDDNGAISLTEDLLDQDVPAYVALSHTWGTVAQEVTFQDFQSLSTRQRISKAGYAKIQFCSDQAKKDGYEYFWIDTCCIDKTNMVELTEAINSMYRWYHEANRCYVYLSDVKLVEPHHNAWQNAFTNSKWFTRGWTLQELLAPQSVEFFSSNGIRLGDKVSLVEEIHEITGIPVDALQGKSLSDFSVSERMGWASKRRTTRKEDEAYSLLGIFDINMPLIYGERDRALIRLREHIDRSLQDPRQAFHSGYNNAGTSMPVPHPVRKNYRRVHVTILYWEADGSADVVGRISDVFRSLYGYEVQEIALPYRRKVKLAWPWLDTSVVDERDLQIMYYLGSTMPLTIESVDFLNFAASPVRRLSAQEIYPDDPHSYESTDMQDPRRWERYPQRDWLSNMISIPNLDSDVLVVLDCFIEGLVRPHAPETIRFLLDDDNSWARYLVVCAGYAKSSTLPGILSKKLMSLLEELAMSKRFYAREGLITSRTLREKLERQVSFVDDLDVHWFGNDGKDFIHLSPLQ